MEFGVALHAGAVLHFSALFESAGLRVSVVAVYKSAQSDADEDRRHRLHTKVGSPSPGVGSGASAPCVAHPSSSVDDVAYFSFDPSRFRYERYDPDPLLRLPGATARDAR